VDDIQGFHSIKFCADFFVLVEFLFIIFDPDLDPDLDKDLDPDLDKDLDKDLFLLNIGLIENYCGNTVK
jgi:hypothetical protein